MRIPSYDDLTPSIPDVAPGEVFASVARLLPVPVEAHPPRRGQACLRGQAPSLFACLRSAHHADVIVEIAKDFSPRIQRYGADSVVLDVSGLGRLLGAPDVIGGELARAAASRDAPAIRVAVAPTQIAALLLSLSDSALTVIDSDEAAALAPLPLHILQRFMGGIHGDALLRGQRFIAPSNVEGRAKQVEEARLFEALKRWGVNTLGELAALPSVDLSARTGQAGVALQRLARGVDLHPLVPDPDVPRFLERIELEWPIDALEPLSFVLARLLDPLSGALERADRAAAALRLDLRLVNRSVHQRMLQLPVALRDPRALRTLLLLDLESHRPTAAIDIVTIEVDPAPGRVIQYSLLERSLPSAETLATLTARLNALVGESRCGTPALLDSHRPDAFEMRRFDLALGAGRSALGISDSQPWTLSPQSPAPSPQPLAVRRFRPPVAVRVSVHRGRPAHVAIDRRGMPGGHVVQAAGPWRSSGAWWDRDSLPWNRDEWDVELSDGAVCRLYREAGMWFMEGVVD